MPTRPVRVVASLLACAVGIAAEVDDVTMTYSYEETAAGRDIHEGIYGSHGNGEFDEWRLHLGVAPGMDRIQLKTSINGNAYPGPAAVETDRLVNDPPMPPQIGLMWVLGDYDSADEGWFNTLGGEFTRRNYKIIYDIGAASVPLNLSALTLHFGMGYAWYLGGRVRYELEPFVNAGMMWTDLDLVDMTIPAPEVKVSGGPVIEGGLRNALIWHPGSSQSWHLGGALDYRTGYAQTIYNSEDAAGAVRSEVRFYWYGICGSIFYGHKF